MSSDGVVQTLLERKLVKPVGRAERIGKPLLYATAPKFLEYFGIADLAQLPKLSEVLPRKENKGLQSNLEFKEFTEVAENAGVMALSDSESDDSSDSESEIS